MHVQWLERNSRGAERHIRGMIHYYHTLVSFSDKKDNMGRAQEAFYKWGFMLVYDYQQIEEQTGYHKYGNNNTSTKEMNVSEIQLRCVKRG